MFDIIFISYDEPNADENWNLLKEIAPHAKRIHGVKGIAQAHIEAAGMVSTDHFFTVDGDNVIDEDFNWERIVDFQKNDQRIHVWRAKNSVNGLVYGYGGVKLWPTDHVENIKKYTVDFTTSVAIKGFKAHEELASETYFNSTPYNAWKGAFRECSKLASGIIHKADKRSSNRLMVWLTIGADVEHGYYSILGARMGTLNGIINNNNEKILSHINDFDWCQEQFQSMSNDIMGNIKTYGMAVEEELGRDILLYDPKQSKLFKELMYGI